MWFQVGQEIEVRPGIVSKDTEGKLTCKPIFSRIMSLFAEQNDLNYAVPGGLIGMSLLSRHYSKVGECDERTAEVVLSCFVLLKFNQHLIPEFRRCMLSALQ